MSLAMISACRFCARSSPCLIRVGNGDAGIRADRAIYLGSRISPHKMQDAPARLPRTLLARLFRQGAFVDGKTGASVEPSLRLNSDDCVRVKDGFRGCPAIFPVRAAEKEKFEMLGHSIDVLYSSDAIAVISKPAGMHSQKGSAEAGVTLDDVLAGIAARLNAASLRLVHRLDKEVGGVVVVAKTRAAAAAISAVLARPGKAVAGLARPEIARVAPSPTAQNGNQDSAGQVRKAYVGVVSGAAARSLRANLERIPAKSGTSIALSRPWPKASGIITATVTHAAEVRGAKPVVSHGVTRFSIAATSPNALLLFLEPVTGRKHQLRQHLARVLGAPLAGDIRYGSTENVGGLALYSAAVAFSGFGSLIPDSLVCDTKFPPFFATLLREHGFDGRVILDDVVRFIGAPQ